MAEEITNQQKAGVASAVPSAQQGVTSGARYGAERRERKPMVSWAALLQEAVTKPGYIHEAYSRFHSYSLGNQLLALYQCLERSISPGPLATFPKWKGCGPSRQKRAKGSDTMHADYLQEHE